MPNTSKAEQGLDAATYKVGYKKPPLETRFGAQRQPDRSRQRAAKVDRPDVAAVLDEPLDVRIKGKRAKMHPHEAMLHGLYKRVLKAELRAIKEFLLLCRAAGLMEPSEGAATSGVIEAPKDIPLELTSRLIREVGPPPWDDAVFATYRAEYDRDLAHLSTLKEEALKRARANGENVY